MPNPASIDQLHSVINPTRFFRCSDLLTVGLEGLFKPGEPLELRDDTLCPMTFLTGVLIALTLVLAAPLIALADLEAMITSSLAIVDFGDWLEGALGFDSFDGIGLLGFIRKLDQLLDSSSTDGRAGAHSS